MRPSSRLSVAIVLALALAPDLAIARDTNPEGIPIGHRAIGMGGAYTAVAGDGVALWYNPAGLGGIEHQGISANLTLYQFYQQKVSPFVRLVGQADLESGDFSSVPSSLVYSLPVGAEGSGQAIAAGVFIPDNDVYSAGSSLGLQEGSDAVIIKYREVRDERTFWVGAGYGIQADGWAAGLALFAAAHTLRQQVIDSVFASTATDRRGLAQTGELSGFDVQALVSAGGRYRLRDGLHLGLTVRSPSLLRLISSASSLSITADEGSQTSAPFVDRFETDQIELDQRYPLRISAGLEWRIDRDLLLTADVRYTHQMARWRSVEAPRLPPTSADGSPLPLPPDELAARTLNLNESRARRAVPNLAIGLEYTVSEALSVRSGFWTDLNTADPCPWWDTGCKKSLPEHPALDLAVNLFSLSVGAGWKGERGSTDFGVLARAGQGRARTPISAGKTDASVLQIGLFLGGSSDL